MQPLLFTIGQIYIDSDLPYDKEIQYYSLLFINGGANMQDKNNAECAICGKGYKLCYSCEKKDAAALWKLHCDTPEHYKIFQIVNGYTTGVYNKDEASERLGNVDLSDLDSLRDNIKTIILEITKKPTKRSRSRKKNIETEQS